MLHGLAHDQLAGTAGMHLSCLHVMAGRLPSVVSGGMHLGATCLASAHPCDTWLQIMPGQVLPGHVGHDLLGLLPPAGLAHIDFLKSHNQGIRGKAHNS